MGKVLKILAVTVAVGAGTLVALDVSPGEARDTGRAVANYLVGKVAVRLPAEIELERVEVVLETADAQLRDKEVALARAEVNLEGAEKSLAVAKGRRDQWLTKLTAARRAIRQLTSTACGQGDDVAREFAVKVSACDELCEATRDREAAVAEQRAALAQATKGLAALRDQREALGHQVAALKSRLQAAGVAERHPETPADGDALAQAKARADGLTERLAADAKVAERLAGWRAAPAPRSADLDSASAKLDELLKSAK